MTSWRGLDFLRDVAKSGYSPPYKTQCTMHNMDACWSVCTSIVALFPGLPTVQFLIACSMQKRRGKAGPFYHVNDISVYIGRQRGRDSQLKERA